MTPNDAQMDLLLRRHSRKGNGVPVPNSGSASSHLDADELSAFAEGALPPAARARYVSHLADCDQCRKLAAQLTMAAGAHLRAVTDDAIVGKISVWQSLRNLFAPASLRYAAFAAIAIAVVGIGFLALRQNQNRNLVAESSPATSSAGSAVKAPDQVASSSNSAPAQAQNPAPSESGQNSNLKSTTRTVDGVVSTAPTPAKEVTGEKDAKVAAASKVAEPDVAKVQPSYAPPPPTERTEAEARKAEGSYNNPSAPKAKQSNDEFSRNRAGEVGGALENQRARSGQDQPSQNQVAVNRSRAPETQSAPRREARDKSNSDTQEQTRSQDATLSSNGPSELRKVGGHSFRREGSAWIDTRFKSSMPIINVSRGSEEFQSLDSSLRSIAAQLSGEAVIVHKGKAYRIR
jgi:Putative zinc-finger